MGASAPTAGARAAALNNLGSELYAKGDYTNADKTLREALATEQSSGQQDTNVELLAGTLFNLAAVTRMQARFTESETLYRRSIAIRESAWGPDSPDLARSLAGLALVYATDGRIQQGLELAGRAVRVSANGGICCKWQRRRTHWRLCCCQMAMPRRPAHSKKKLVQGLEKRVRNWP